MISTGILFFVKELTFCSFSLAVLRQTTEEIFESNHFLISASQFSKRVAGHTITTFLINPEDGGFL